MSSDDDTPSDDTPDEIEAEDFKHLAEAVRLLNQHFDTVHVFVSRVEGGQTLGASQGSGNWFARFGQIEVWVRSNS